jgi:hypothetical protein
MATEAPAPIKGAPPSLEWVPLDRLQIDETYQRDIAATKAQQLIKRIAAGWDWRLYQPLSVARRGDGQLFVIDGQHRLAAARLRPDLPHLPCVISAFDATDDEARAFAAMNRERRTLTRLEIYRAEIASGDARACRAQELIEQAGLKLAAHTNTAHWPPGTIDCIGGVVRGMAQNGEQVTLNALTAMGEAWGKGRVLCAGSVLFGLLALYDDPPPGFDPDLLIAAMSETTGRDLFEAAADYRRFYSDTGLRMRAALVDLMKAHAQ